MALLLSLETSTHHFSCALHLDQKLIAYKESEETQSTSLKLAVVIADLFKAAAVEQHQLSAVVVAAGPGSYTGLRMGVATAKGICYALNIPLISVNTLYLMAHQFVHQFSASSDHAIICPMLDARRMEVYCLLADRHAKVISPTQAKVIDENSFADELNTHEFYFFGEGADKCSHVIRHRHANFVVGVKPSASYLGILGHEKFLNKEFENSETFEPFYLKDFIIKKPKPIS